MTLPKTPPTKFAATASDAAEKVTKDYAYSAPIFPVIVPEDGIGKRIREARQRPENDLSQEALSRLCREYDPEGKGIAPTTLLRYEKGDVLPGARELRILCDALEVSADWLIFGAEHRGYVSMDAALQCLAVMLQERLTAENPLAYPAKQGDLAHQAQRLDRLVNAKTPPKR